MIRTKPSLSARLENVLSTALAKLDTTSNNINELLSADNLASVKSTLANLAQVTQTLAASKDPPVKRGDCQRRPDVRPHGSRNDATRAGNRAHRPQRRRAGKNGQRSRGRERHRGQDRRFGRRRTSKRFTADALPEVQRLLGEMSVLAASLRRLSEKIEGSPGGLLIGRRPVPPGPGEKATK